MDHKFEWLNDDLADIGVELNNAAMQGAAIKSILYHTTSTQPTDSLGI